jgi:hypothetical protein
MIEHGCVGVYERLITVWVVSSHAGVLFQEIILSDTLSKSRLTAAAYLRDTQGFASSFAFAKSDKPTFVLHVITRVICHDHT